MFEVGERVLVRERGTVKDVRGEYCMVVIDGSPFALPYHISKIEPENSTRSSTTRRLKAWKERGGVL